MRASFYWLRLNYESPEAKVLNTCEPPSTAVGSVGDATQAVLAPRLRGYRVGAFEILVQNFQVGD